jgi:hypothetical protein
VLIGLLLGHRRRGLARTGPGRQRLQPPDLGDAGADRPDAGLRRARRPRHGKPACRHVTGRSARRRLLCAALLPLARRFDAWDMQQWLWETWRFVKMIFPLLVVGVFLVGVIRVFIQPEWIQAVAGSNTVLANLAGVVFGVFMYFPTLVEVPIAKMFLSLGMHPGPLIAYLMADPELSLQSILITSAIIGKLKAWTYVGLVALFSTLAGLTYGAWVDGTSLVAAGCLIGLSACFIACTWSSALDQKPIA